jgi:hypothetical protein
MPSVRTFSEIQRAVVEYAEAMTTKVQVPDDVFDAVRRHFNDREVMELTASSALAKRDFDAVEPFMTLDGPLRGRPDAGPRQRGPKSARDRSSAAPRASPAQGVRTA